MCGVFEPAFVSFHELRTKSDRIAVTFLLLILIVQLLFKRDSVFDISYISRHAHPLRVARGNMHVFACILEVSPFNSLQ
jgi:hypothetical protein